MENHHASHNVQPQRVNAMSGSFIKWGIIHPIGCKDLIASFLFFFLSIDFIGGFIVINSQMSQDSRKIKKIDCCKKFKPLHVEYKTWQELMNMEANNVEFIVSFLFIVFSKCEFPIDIFKAIILSVMHWKFCMMIQSHLWSLVMVSKFHAV